MADITKQVEYTDPPPAPTELTVVDVEKVKGDWFVTLSWTDNAPDEYVTCFKFTGSENMTFCTWSGTDYPEGTGARTARMKMPRGSFSVVAYAENWHVLGYGITSPMSDPVTVNANGSGK